MQAVPTPLGDAALTPHARTPRQTATLSLLALGVVYGDIGTSPLYAVKEAFNPQHGIAFTHENILGGLSAIFWSLMLVVSLKYITLVLRADNRGEGGVMALMALASASAKGQPRLVRALMIVGVSGAALFYGDAVLTPAMSVLSAIEGLEVGTAAFKPYVLPISLGVLLALFMIQHQGTGRVGAWFGPLCMLWFLSLGVAGLWNIAAFPGVLAAIDPMHGARFVTSHGMASFLVLGSVLLAITGAEALYADMGHFGSRAIRWAWFGMAAPALVLNYFGQGALLMSKPGAIDNPFYLCFPAWALYPMVMLATVATVIASQATISGAFSLTRQAIQLGYLPRTVILHTSTTTAGQIYIPMVNWLLLIAIAAAVIGFGSSTRLASAYGVSVMGTMAVTTLMMCVVAIYRWRMAWQIVLAVASVFLILDLAFLGAAVHKILDGGWFPLALGALLFCLMTTWRYGRDMLMQRLGGGTPPLEEFLASVQRFAPQRVPGTAVFLTSTAGATPHALLHSLKHYKVMHECNVFLTVTFDDIPNVESSRQIECDSLPSNCYRVLVRYGFSQQPDIPLALEKCGAAGLQVDAMTVSYFLSRERIVPIASGGFWAHWRQMIFSTMARNAGNAADYFQLPVNRVVEVGTQVEV